MKTQSLMISLRSGLFLIPALLATSAALGDNLHAPLRAVRPTDAQAQAAALLSRPHSFAAASAGLVLSVPATSTPADAQAKAAALLSRPRTEVDFRVTIATQPSHALRSADGQAQAAALLSHPRTT